jgi:hypothetical protein
MTDKEINPSPEGGVFNYQGCNLIIKYQIKIYNIKINKIKWEDLFLELLLQTRKSL